MNERDETFFESLREALGERTCIVGIGSRLRGDDAIGPRVIDGRPAGVRGAWIDAGSAPENFLEPIVQTDPDTVLFVDAVDFGGQPGEYRLLEPAVLDGVVLSTHAGSLRMLSDYLEARTGARVAVLAIQPERLDPGSGLSPRVAESVDRVIGLLSAALSRAVRVETRS